MWSALTASPRSRRVVLPLSLLLNLAIILLIVLPPPYYPDRLARLKLPEIDLEGFDLWVGQTERASKECGLCDVNPGLCQELGSDNIAKAIGFSGSNIRLRRFLQKASRGDPFTVAVVGGSVSGGHGLNDLPEGPYYSPRNMHRRVFEHLCDLFPQNDRVLMEGASEGVNGFVNGAQGGKAINDELHMGIPKPYELMLRGLLDLPSQPAILSMQIFALMFGSIALGGDLHESFSQYYDIPIVSLRNVLLPQALDNVTLVQELFVNKGPIEGESLENVDLRHLSGKGHALMADLVNAYIDGQRCAMDVGDSWEEDYTLAPLPRLRLFEKYDPYATNPTLKPDCFSMDGTKHPLVPSQNEGWRPWNWKNKNYLIADQPGSSFTVPFHSSFGTVSLYYLRSSEFGLGSVSCWVDEDKELAQKAEGYWVHEFNIGQTLNVREDLQPGEHELHCELLATSADPGKGTEFRVISVMR
ncbi:hypothetical protein M231_02870 [Tremella mesenterica]|uniref:Uncharacterized protein n=1 Tax=Tremella mesenterica TaxID=5217 RepID=A0A4Q1BPI6_TREME|nr:hypothetical protein M231_02870 [Tremella mesenterica]